MQHILTPNRSLSRHESIEATPFFMAGPVSGGGDWQAKAYRLLCEHHRQFYAAIPIPPDRARLGNLAYDSEHPLAAYFTGVDKGEFERQLDWETHHLMDAARCGCIIFWFPEESTTNPRPGGDYSRDTRGEIGEWRGRMAEDMERLPAERKNYRVVVGGEAGFPGFDVMCRNQRKALGPNFPIYPTLAETVAAAVAMAVRRAT